MKPLTARTDLAALRWRKMDRVENAFARRSDAMDRGCNPTGFKYLLSKIWVAALGGIESEVPLLARRWPYSGPRASYRAGSS